MSDYTELQKASAYAAQDTIKFADEDEEMRALQQFHEEVDPETVLALIAENDQLKKDRRTEHQSLRSDKARNSLYMMIATSIIDDHPYERTGSDWDYEHPIHDKIISFLAERDQLRAEVAGLRTGYEAYERVNAELKAENEVLKKRIDDMSPFKGAPLTGPDLKCLACGEYHYGLQGLPCPNMRITASAALGRGEQP